MPSVRSLCVLASLQGLHGLRQREASQEVVLRPDFFACEWEEAEADPAGCSEMAGVPSRNMDELLRAGYRRMKTVRMTGRRPLAVHVGADGLGNMAKWTDMHLYTRVLERSSMPRGALRMAFVEPIEAKAQRFWQKVEHLPVDKRQVSLHTAVIDGKCKADTETFFRLSERAGRDFGFDDIMTQGWMSTNPAHPLSAVGNWVLNNNFMPCIGDMNKNCAANLRRFWDSPNRNSYVDGMSIPCQSLSELVASTKSQLRDLSMLVVDAEGLDTKILTSIVDAEDFQPGFIMWEVADPTRIATQLNHLIEVLRGKGYAVGVKTGMEASATRGQTSFLARDAMNFVAVLETKPGWGSAKKMQPRLWR